MGFYRKKPVLVEARQYVDNASAKDIIEWAPPGVIAGPFDEDRSPYLAVQTEEGTMRADLNDWVIKGVAHEFYPCKPDIFGFTYEEVSPG